MTALAETTHNPGVAMPYGDLFIYYFEGTIARHGLLSGPEFIGNWEEDGFSFLFFSRESGETVRAILALQPELVLLDQFEMTYEEWLGEKPAPLQIGRFTISPPWDKPENIFLPGFGAFHILLDPGVVFGTGTHPTTHDCLELIDRAFSNHTIEQVLDLGTGTGLLALAAAKLKCKKVLAVDFNYLAVKTTHRNIQINDFSDRILAVQGLAQDFISTPSDLLISNIHYDVMKDVILSDGFLKHKQFILSGLMHSQAELVEISLSRLPVEIIEKRSLNGIWYTYYGTVL